MTNVTENKVTNANQWQQPSATARLLRSGVALVAFDGHRQEFTERTDDDAMRAAMTWLTTQAQRIQGHIYVTATDAAGSESVLLVNRDGSVRTAAATISRRHEEDAPAATAAVEQHAHTAAPAPSPEALHEPPLRERMTARDFAETRRPPSAAPATVGFRGFVNRVFKTALAPNASEQEGRVQRSSIQRGLLGHKTVSIVNVKGGVGKTTTTYLLSAVLGRVRGGNILAWDNNENKGTLGDRSIRAGHDHTALDLLEHADDFATPANAQHLVNYTRPQGDNKFSVLASQDRGSTRQVIDGAAFTKLHAVLRQFFHLILVDTGNASNAATWQAAVGESDAIVLVTTNKEDAMKPATSTIDDLAAQGHLDRLRRGVAIVTETQLANAEQRRAAAERLERFASHVSGYVREVVVIPFDAALDDGDDIVFDRLAPATVAAYTRAAAAIIDGL